MNELSASSRIELKDILENLFNTTCACYDVWKKEPRRPIMYPLSDHTQSCIHCRVCMNATIERMAYVLAHETGR